MSDQDWTPVVITKRKTKSELLKSGERRILEKKPEAGANHHSSITGYEVRNLESTELVAPIRSDTIALQIQQARQIKSMSQADLNKACNLPLNTVRRYENGTAVIKQNELTAMSKVLGISIKKPKTIKKSIDE
jgi:ribosome-binding protein aMBF1 (putative translation factor)